MHSYTCQCSVISITELIFENLYVVATYKVFYLRMKTKLGRENALHVHNDTLTGRSDDNLS